LHLSFLKSVNGQIVLGFDLLFIWTEQMNNNELVNYEEV
jgi:hypothetical protein